jgi:hypothetical protein
VKRFESQHGPVLHLEWHRDSASNRLVSIGFAGLLTAAVVQLAIAGTFVHIACAILVALFVPGVLEGPFLEQHVEIDRARRSATAWRYSRISKKRSRQIQLPITPSTVVWYRGVGATPYASHHATLLGPDPSVEYVLIIFVGDRTEARETAERIARFLGTTAQPA